MQAIRIEHPYSGEGMWRHRNRYGGALIESLECHDELELKHREFPTPILDSLIDRNIEYGEYCAFKSIEQIQQWIDKEWWNEIIAFGFKVYFLELSECTVGEYQILFCKEHITSSKDITSLFVTTQGA